MNLPVWLYWEGDTPEWIIACRHTIFRHAIDVRLITPESFDKLRDCDCDIDLSGLCIAHRADFIRAFLLSKFGGVWIDSDCIILQPLQPLLESLSENDFIAFRQLGGDLSNSFIGSKPNGTIAGIYYRRICEILRSGQPIEWLTIGSYALMAAINESGVPWYEIDRPLIQPVCWSNPAAFFEKRNEAGHRAVFNQSAYCYMLSNSMIIGFIKENPGRNLLEEDSFFSFLLKESAQPSVQSLIQHIAYRKNTDDDLWVIPEVMVQDMYRIREVLSGMEPAGESYVLDCGAHIGTFSVMCSCYLKHVEIISFEPNPDSFDYLHRNAGRFRKINAVNKAVGISDGLLNLFAPDEDDWSGRWSVIPNANRSVSVEAVNLFSFIKELDKPVFVLKMDLEGYEEIILNGSKEDDLSKVNTIIIETHTGVLDHAKLMRYGYRLLFQPHISSARQFVYTRN